MNQVSLRGKILILVLGATSIFALLSLVYMYRETNRLNQTVAEYRLSTLVSFLTHQFTDSL